jgi:hypothetical protein
MYLPCFHLGRGLHMNVSELRADTLRYKKPPVMRGAGRNANAAGPRGHGGAVWRGAYQPNVKL